MTVFCILYNLQTNTHTEQRAHTVLRVWEVWDICVMGGWELQNNYVKLTYFSLALFQAGNRSGTGQATAQSNSDLVHE